MYLPKRLTVSGKLKTQRFLHLLKKTRVQRKKVRARNEGGHFIADDPSTPENEAWTTKVVKKVTRKKK
jgi:hypothetical protein